MLERMNGMFAFALYDRYQRRILLARDRFGEKPLYVYHGTDAVLFASEIKALLAHPAVRVEIDADGLSQYRVFQHTLGERTLFRGITQLEPASYLEASPTPARCSRRARTGRSRPSTSPCGRAITRSLRRSSRTPCACGCAATCRSAPT